MMKRRCVGGVISLGFFLLTTFVFSPVGSAGQMLIIDWTVESSDPVSGQAVTTIDLDDLYNPENKDLLFSWNSLKNSANA